MTEPALTRYRVLREERRNRFDELDIYKTPFLNPSRETTTLYSHAWASGRFMTILRQVLDEPSTTTVYDRMVEFTARESDRQLVIDHLKTHDFDVECRAPENKQGFFLVSISAKNDGSWCRVEPLTDPAHPRRPEGQPRPQPTKERGPAEGVQVVGKRRSQDAPEAVGINRESQLAPEVAFNRNSEDAPQFVDQSGPATQLRNLSPRRVRRKNQVNTPRNASPGTGGGCRCSLM